MDARQTVVALIVLLIGMGVVWLLLVAWLLRRLRTHHTEVYNELGAPSLFWNNSPRNSWSLLKFIWSSRIAKLDDPPIRHVALFMRVLYLCNLALFFTTMYLFTSKVLRRR